MQDLQVGFSAAMNELSNIQDEDKILHEKMNSSKREHDTQMSDIVDLVQSLKVNQLSHHSYTYNCSSHKVL